MPPKPLPTDIRSGPGRKTKPTGPFVVVNPHQGRKQGAIPKGRFFIQDADKMPCAHQEGCALPGCHKVTVWREGDVYTGKRVAVRLEHGSIKPAKGGK